MRIRLLYFVLALWAGLAFAAGPPALDCQVGPLNKTYGGSPWLVYSCSDGRSLVFVSAPGSPAMPFIFTMLVGQKDFRLHGEGTGNKQATDAAYRELSVLTANDIATLVAQSKNATTAAAKK